MDTRNVTFSQLLPVIKLAFLCTCISLILAMFSVFLCVLPLSVFVICCLAAPFFPRFGFYLPVISQGSTGKNMVALTFDDGPDPETTPLLLELLAQHAVTATFFVIGEKVHKHPELMREIIAKGHAVGNHSYHHDILLMLRSSKKIAKEICMGQQALSKCGIKPLIFRPPVGITNPKLGPILKHQGLFCVNFSCRGFDAGNRRIDGLADRILKKISPDDIVLLHDCRPRRGASVTMWLREIEVLLDGLERKNLLPVPLESLIGRPVCSCLPIKAL